jgi:hypothetical protein
VTPVNVFDRVLIRYAFGKTQCSLRKVRRRFAPEKCG